MSKNNKGSQPTKIYKTPTAPAMNNIPKYQPRIINESNVYETINNAIYENEAAQNTPDVDEMNNKINSQHLLTTKQIGELNNQKTLYNSVKEELNNQKAIYRSVNESVTENKHNIDGISHKLDQVDKLINPKILVMGGYNGEKSTPSSDIFLLDYREKIWKKVSIKLPNDTRGHGTVILDDQLYIIGGKETGSNYYNTLYRLNKQMKWEKLADMHEKRTYIGSSCLVHNGHIWVVGGYSGNSYSKTMEKYNPSTNRWEMKPAMKRPRAFFAAAINNKKIYVCGGWNGSSRLDSVEVFDIESEIWTDFNTLPAPRSDMSVIVDGASITLIGGFGLNIENTVWKMDVEEEKNNGWKNLPPLNEGRYAPSAVRIESDAILVVGGCQKSGCGNSSSAVEIFDGHKWESITQLPAPRSYHTSVVLTQAMIDAFHPYAHK